MPDASPRFHPPPGNMVQEVRNIVEGYKMGPLRALAQDPVQNSYDARKPGAEGPVKVDYRLHRRRLASGGTMFLLTVTDRNTTGLQGPVLALEDLQRRADETGYLQLQPDENWAAWEAMGYTKAGEDYLGSRGQGKAAFLYHSRHATGLRGPGGRPLEQMVMLYDTLLGDGTYRLGVRLAQPADLVRHPPFEGDEAREVVRGQFEGWRGSPIPLNLQPLEEIGTRIIVPFLSAEAAEAFHSGELARWLERCWWRAVQVGDLEITLGAEPGESVAVGVPAWWAREPWRTRSVPDHLLVKENVRLEPGWSPLKIKRIVLFHDAELASDEIEGEPGQYSGVQLLRGRQWIETLGVAEKFGDFIPPHARDGFRGFVEFNQPMERELREVESPQHDTFYRHRTIVKQIDAHIRDAVREFAEREGWTIREPKPEEEDRAADEILQKVVDIFVAEAGPGRRRRQPPLVWDCELDLDFPRPASARVDWGETVRNVCVACSQAPPDQRKDVTMTLSLVAPDGEATEIASRTRRTNDGRAAAEFGDFTLTRVARRGRELACPEPGKYRLRAVCVADGQMVASASRNIYVRVDPPPREPRPFSLNISVSNVTADRVRINHGDAINVAVAVTSRRTDDAVLRVDASLESLLLADSVRADLPGRPEGDSPATRMLSYTNIRVFTTEPEEEPDGLYVVLQPGRHFVRADASDESGGIVANAARAVFVEVDPEESGGGVPFDVRARETAAIPYPVWELEPPHGDGALWILWYAKHHPTYLAALAADERRPVTDGLYGTRHFWAETICGALVEWALILYRDQGDDGGFRLPAEQGDGAGELLWERYATKVEELMGSYRDSLTCLALKREVVSLMLYILRGQLS